MQYSAHVQYQGWQPTISEGIAGTTGKGLRMEAIKMNIKNIEDVSLNFDVHIENIGWRYNLTEKDVIGTSGKSLRLEAIVIRANGLLEKGYKLQYRVHIQNFGWTSWIDEGNMAGTVGKSLRLEAIEARIVEDITASEKLDKAKDKAVEELTNYVENSALKKKVAGSDTQYASIHDINQAILAGYTAIDASKSEEELEQSLNDTKENIVNVTREYVQFLLDTVYENQNENSYELFISSAKYAAYSAGISEATTVEDIIGTYEAALGDRVSKDVYDFENSKERAIQQLKSYKNPDDYKLHAEELENAINDGSAAIQNLSSENGDDLVDVLNTLSEAKEAIDAIKTDAEELAALDGIKDTKLGELSDYLEAENGEGKSLKKHIGPDGIDTATNYLSVPTINKAYTDGFGMIGLATTEEDVSRALENTKTNVASATKEYVLGLLEKLYTEGTVDHKFITTEGYETFKNTINNASTANEVIANYEAAQDSKYLKSVDDAKITATSDIDAYITALNNNLVDDATKQYSDLDSVKNAIESAKEAITNASTVKEVDEALEKGKAEILSSAKTEVQSLLDTVYNSGNSLEDGKFLATSVYEENSNGIKNATVITDIVTKYEYAYNARTDLSGLQTTAKSKLSAYVNSYKTTTGQEDVTNASQLVSIAEGKIDNATNPSTIDSAVSDAENGILELAKTYWISKLDSFKEENFVSHDDHTHYLKDTVYTATVSKIKSADSIESMKNIMDALEDETKIVIN